MVLNSDQRSGWVNFINTVKYKVKNKIGTIAEIKEYCRNIVDGIAPTSHLSTGFAEGVKEAAGLVMNLESLTVL